MYSFTPFLFHVFGSIQTVICVRICYVLFLEYNVPGTSVLIPLASLGYPSSLLPEEGWNPWAVRTMDQRHGKLVIREASWPCHITSRTVTKAEYRATETGTRQAWITSWSQGRWRGQWWGKWLNNNNLLQRLVHRVFSATLIRRRVRVDTSSAAKISNAKWLFSEAVKSCFSTERVTPWSWMTQEVFYCGPTATIYIDVELTR